MARYIKVTAKGHDGDEITELPLEDDNTLPLADVASQFPGAIGLKAIVGENSTRAVKIRGANLYPLDASEDDDTVFVVVQQAKRGRDDDTEGDARTKASKMPQLEVIVLGLPFEEKEEGVRAYFEKYGDVTDVDLKKQPNGKSRGFGFVKFKEEEVVRVVASENHTIGGRACTVKVPYKRDERPAGPVVTKLFIGKLPETITDAQLRKCFSVFGALKDVYIPQRPFRGIAYVEFVEREAMEKALAQNHTVDGVELNVSMATPRTYNPSGPGGGGGGPGPGGRYGGYGGYGGAQFQGHQGHQGGHPGYGQGHNGGYGGPPSAGGGGWGARPQHQQWSGGHNGPYTDDYTYRAGGGGGGGGGRSGGWNGQGY